MKSFTLVFDRREPLTDVKAHCTCGEFDFEGDWDDLCNAWASHTRDPEFKYLWIDKGDHECTSLLTREATVRFKKILEAKKAREDS